MIDHDQMQGIEELSFIFMKPLDVHIKHRIGVRVRVNWRSLLPVSSRTGFSMIEKIDERLFVLPFDVEKFLLAFWIAGKFGQAGESKRNHGSSSGRSVRR